MLQPFTGVQQPPESVQKTTREAAGRKRHSLEIADALDAAGMVRAAKRQRACGGFLALREWQATGRVTVEAAQWCNQRLSCLSCARAAAMRNVRRLVPLVERHLREHDDIPAMVTLTIANGPDLAERLEAFGAALRQAGQRRLAALKRPGRRSEFARVRAAAWFLEIKRGSRSGLWHVHAHGLCFLPRGQRFSFPALWPEWAACCGQPVANGNVTWTDAGRLLLKSRKRFHELPERDRQELVGDLLEVCKYSLKFGDLEPSDVVAVARTAAGRQLRRSWGQFSTPDEDAGADLHDEAGPFVEYLFRWLGEAYGLKSARRSDPADAGEPLDIPEEEVPF